jgi:hypothetical protein
VRHYGDALMLAIELPNRIVSYTIENKYVTLPVWCVLCCGFLQKETFHRHKQVQVSNLACIQRCSQKSDLVSVALDSYASGDAYPKTALSSRNSSSPASPHSRPLPDCL